jgi:hypothetical protein
MRFDGVFGLLSRQGTICMGEKAMPIITCFVDDKVLHILEQAQVETGRGVADLAEAAIANAAFEYKRVKGRIDEHYDRIKAAKDDQE